MPDLVPELRVEPVPVDADALAAEYEKNQQSIIETFIENGMSTDNPRHMEWLVAAFSGEPAHHPAFASATSGPMGRAAPRQTVHILPRALRKHRR